MEQGEEQLLSGWGGVPRHVCRTRTPWTVDEAASLLGDRNGETVIARGLGRSYGDTALNAGGAVLLRPRWNRMIAWDPEQGLLTCEAGVSLDEIIEHFLPRGWFPLVTPGTRYVTVGGAIACDVHGKNHHRQGSFSTCVQWLDLLQADGSVQRCDRQQTPELFAATVGGVGLTGVILRAQLRLRRIHNAWCRVQYERMTDLAATMARLAETNDQHEYSVAWIDCLARGRTLGRSVLMLGDHADAEPGLSLTLPRRRTSAVPVEMPSATLNRLTVAAFNELYYRLHPTCEKLVDVYSYFYPLDGLLHWNRIYGRRGFVQYQALLPPDRAVAGMTALLERIAASGGASFLAVLKASGPAGEGLLSYLFPGYTLALDLGWRGETTRRLTRDLDRVVLDHGGRLYLAKDALMDEAAFAAMYPQKQVFCDFRGRVDPQRRFSSSQARRVGLA